MFTRNGVPGTQPVQDARRDKWALALTVLAGLAWTSGLPAPVTASLALFAAVGQAARLLGWQPWRTWRNPLLWILHVSSAWIPFGFVLLALA
jgi:uncharacterized protein involved in response to NO